MMYVSVVGNCVGKKCVGCMSEICVLLIVVDGIEIVVGRGLFNINLMDELMFLCDEVCVVKVVSDVC